MKKQMSKLLICILILETNTQNTANENGALEDTVTVLPSLEEEIQTE